MATKKETKKRGPGKPTTRRPNTVRVHMWLWLTPDEKKKWLAMSSEERLKKLLG